MLRQKSRLNLKPIEVPEKSGKSLHFAHWLFLPPVPENKPSKTQAGMEAESPSLQVLTPVTVSAHPEAGRPYLQGRQLWRFGIRSSP